MPYLQQPAASGNRAAAPGQRRRHQDGETLSPKGRGIQRKLGKGREE
ncbi:MAG: hypothetical protein LBU16_07385 [Treponema sp.]|nr:hypothetical protein [Treponema sp.]